MATPIDGDLKVAERGRTKTFAKETLGAFISGVLALLGFWRISGVSWSDLGGLWGRSDAVVEYSMAKTQSNSILGIFDPNLGYPHGQDWTHFPVLDPANRIELSLLTAFLDPVTAVNVLLVASFPIVAILMYAALRNLHVLRSLAVFGGVSLALVGYHFDYEHPFLGNYWAVPIGILWLSVLANADSVLAQRCQKRTVTAVGLVAAVAVGLNNPQYALFFSLIGVTAVIFARRNSPGSLRFVPRVVVLLIPGLALFAFLALGRLLRTIPAVTSSAERPVEDSYIWAGPFISLLTIPGDSILSALPFNQALLAAQDTSVWTGVSAIQSAPVLTATLIIIGLTWSLVGVARTSTRKWDHLADPVRPWSVMWLTGAFLFITGGMGVAFAALVYPQVRVWSRISIILAAVALTGALIFATRLIRLWKSQPSGKSTALIVSLATLVAIAFLDQFTARYQIQADVVTLSALNKLSEPKSTELPDDCPILNIPVMSFPEGIPLGRTEAYDNLLPYLAATPWRFSYGAIRGQLGSRWTDHLAVQPDVLAGQAATEGFCAILVDSYGLDENSPSLPQYEQALGSAIASALDRWFLFALPKTERVDPVNSLFSKPEVNYGLDFSSEEVSDEGVVSRWIKEGSATLKIWNPSSEALEWITRTTLTAADCTNSQEVQVSTSEGFSETFQILPNEQREIDIPLRIPAQSGVEIHFETNSRGCLQSGQSSPAGVRLDDLRFSVTNQLGVEIATFLGFHSEETSGSGETWRWIDGSEGVLRLLSTSDETATVTVTGSLQAAPCQPSALVDVKVDGRLVEPVVITAQDLSPISIAIELEPFGSASVAFATASDGCKVDGDERLLGPKLQNLRIAST